LRLPQITRYHITEENKRHGQYQIESHISQLYVA